MGISIKGKGGGARVTIDGKPATEKLDLVKTVRFLYNQQYKFPALEPLASFWTNSLRLSNNENIFFVNKRYGNSDVYKGSTKKGWTLLGRISHFGGGNADNYNCNHYYYLDKNDCIYYLDKNSLVLKKMNLIDFTETIVSPGMSSDGNSATMCVPFNDYVFVMSGKKYMYKIKNNILTDITSKVLGSGFPFYQLPVGVFEKDGYLYLFRDSSFFKTKDLETWNYANAENGYYNIHESVLFTIKDNIYIAEKNFISVEETNLKVKKIENDNCIDVGLIKSDSYNSFKNGVKFLYIENDEKFYAMPVDKEIILLNDVIYKEREV